MKPRLKLPPGNSLLWKDLDVELEARLGVEFTPRDIEAKSTAELAEAFGRIVYGAMAERFEAQVESRRHEEKKRPPDPRLAELRALKKDLRKAHREVVRTGGKGTEAERVMSKRWFEVVHEHAKLSMALKARDAARRSTKKQSQFRADPMKFGKSLFEKSVSGAPAFSESDGYAYFSKLYRDVARGDKQTALPEMTRPARPSFVLSEDCPSESELEGIIKLKRNGAAPGIDGIRYVPRCLVRVLFKIFKKVWVTKDIPAEWATASIQLLAKSGNLNDPAEFVPLRSQTQLARFSLP